jgi:hypothetical protein
LKTKRFLEGIIILALAILVAGCERGATRSAWSPINTAPDLTTQPSTRSPTWEPTQGAAKPISTPEFIPTLDMNSLPETFPVSLKGYELLSWRHEGDWVFTLMTGTNRAKSFEEILSAENQYSSDALIKISVRGLEELKVVLGRLPRGEQISWGGMNLEGEVPANTLYFTFPPDEIVEEIVKFCGDAGLTLVTLKEN